MTLNEMLYAQQPPINDYLTEALQPFVDGLIIDTETPGEIGGAFGAGVQFTLEFIQHFGIPTDLEEIIHGEKV